MIDKTKIQFDLLIQTDPNNPLLDEFKKNGGRVYCIPKITILGYAKLVLKVKDFFNENNEFISVHSHSDDKSYLIFKYAKRSGITNRIIHIHSSSFGDARFKFIRKINQRRAVRLATNFIAVSRVSALWLYGKKMLQKNKVLYLNNGIECDKFAFKLENRIRFKSEMNLRDNFVIGHIGRFTYAKNHDFIISVFSELLKIKANSILLLIGDGPTKTDIYEKISKLGLKDNVIMLGFQKDISKYLHVMDAFLFPSHYEGFPLSLVEAQSTGLACYVSDSVTDEVCLTPLINFISLKKDPQYWAKIIADSSININRELYYDAIKNAGFDSIDIIKKLVSLYL